MQEILGIFATVGLVTVIYMVSRFFQGLYKRWKENLVSLIRYNTMACLVNDNENLKRENKGLKIEVHSMEHKIKCMERRYQ